jgi:hypothetical protein
MILETLVEENIKLSLEKCFGYWIDGLWYSDINLSIEQRKEVFFLTLKKLLDDNKVVLFAPYSMFNESTNQWDKTVTIRKYGDTIWDIRIVIARVVILSKEESKRSKRVSAMIF